MDMSDMSVYVLLVTSDIGTLMKSLHANQTVQYLTVRHWTGILYMNLTVHEWSSQMFSIVINLSNKFSQYNSIKN